MTIMELSDEETFELISLKSLIRDSVYGAMTVLGLKGNRINKYCQVEDAMIDKTIDRKIPIEMMLWHALRDAIRYRGVKE